MASSDSNQRKIVTEFPGTIRVYDDGTVERLRDTDFVPPSISVGGGGVSSKDVVINSNFSARLYLPPHCHRKLPLLLYFHGGAFCISSPFCGKYHRYVSRLAAEARVVVVSFAYRLAPEHPIPAAYDDARAGIRWAVSHRAGNGPEPWLNDHVDFDRVLLSGESAGGNIVHNLAMAVGDPEFGCRSSLAVKIHGLVMIHPYFWGKDPIGLEKADGARKAMVDNWWTFVCPSNEGCDDPYINPFVGGAPPSAEELGCQRVAIFVAERDILCDRGKAYYRSLARSEGQNGKVRVELVETKGEDHIFHLFNPDCEAAAGLFDSWASFINHE
ncbi:unnamed protein product [Linum tenue]|uniref:Alpha/beta hydrolase fold-3 domain-containing protein n=1 Tax=Linum tenue TaxID=586396 RepID=A0AAV0RKW4_9ROSI|nr:unnamed protein product [Linum tenue]